MPKKEDYEYGDNAGFNIVGLNRKTFNLAMKLGAEFAYPFGDDNRFWCYTIDERLGFVLLTSFPQDKIEGIKVQSFPSAIGVDMLSDIVWHWLKNLKGGTGTLFGNLLTESEHAKADSDFGFRVYTTDRIKGGFLAIKPWHISYERTVKENRSR